jgi:hypothetical protein
MGERSSLWDEQEIPSLIFVGVSGSTAQEAQYNEYSDILPRKLSANQK